ncbi:hypothetical protein SADUNF_Sadunf05G0034100 [Salix dunnii]|uniref:K Homology domain-containing protein n=1 Tax=Salix dunnii TaxID=1413687 RepID=A0A835MYJ5_9ROSI|nr:hypothetical protein SADUNF_Sadunf05G0034100 [Salix dunnii]
MQIPLSYADAVIGTAGASISYIRRASGATVTIQETRGVPEAMTVEISGTASQVLTGLLVDLLGHPINRVDRVNSLVCSKANLAWKCPRLIAHYVDLPGQNFMAEAGAPSQPPTGGPADQGYNPYSHSSVYASPPSNPEHTGHTGGYGSMYGANFGY